MRKQADSLFMFLALLVVTVTGLLLILVNFAK